MKTAKQSNAQLPGEIGYKFGKMLDEGFKNISALNAIGYTPEKQAPCTTPTAGRGTKLTKLGVIVGTKDRCCLENLREALLLADRRIIWESYVQDGWEYPDSDVHNMIKNIDDFLTENVESLPKE